ncbi:type III-A CRISPR-associated protein Csm2 [Desulfobacterales bacterium HSG2]|nr:type III-A CRISPR-associated protein Csm2 [Desulfobacterales bacterium HSG2]
MSNIFIDEVCEEKIPVKTILENLKNIPLGDQEEELPCYAAMIAEELHKKRITPTQLRRFYTYVKAIGQKNLHLKPDEEIKDKAKLKFLLPKLAGSVKRTEKSKIEPLYRVIASCLHDNRIQEVKDLELFIEFFEAILDYHETFR